MRGWDSGRWGGGGIGSGCAARCKLEPYKLSLLVRWIAFPETSFYVILIL